MARARPTQHVISVVSVSGGLYMCEDLSELNHDTVYICRIYPVTPRFPCLEIIIMGSSPLYVPNLFCYFPLYYFNL